MIGQTLAQYQIPRLGATLLAQRPRAGLEGWRGVPTWSSALAGLATVLIAGAAPAAEVRVMVSAGFYQAYSELGPAFERSTGHRLVTTRGPSLGDSPEAIPNRLKRGEPADVVILVGAPIDDLERQGLVRPGSKVDLARSQIGMVVRAGAGIPDIGTADAFRHALLSAKSIAYSDSASGSYLSTTLFARLGVADQLAGKTQKVRGPPSGEPVAAVVSAAGLDGSLGWQATIRKSRGVLGRTPK